MLNQPFNTIFDWTTTSPAHDGPEEVIKDLDNFIMAALLTELNELRQRQKDKLKEEEKEPKKPQETQAHVATQKEDTEAVNTKPPDKSVSSTPVVTECQYQYHPVSIWKMTFWFLVMWLIAWPIATLASPLFVVWQPIAVFLPCAQTPMRLLTTLTMLPTKCAGRIIGRYKVE